MFKNWIINIIVNTIVLVVIAGYIDSFHLNGVSSALIASIILSILNLIVKPILVILTLPVTVFTLGLFLFVINAITLWITAGIMGPDFKIDGFGTALLAAVIMAVCNVIIQTLIIKPLRKK
ncbi:putative membrane protein [Scopulibacillus darangshiensis]|uniref:Putative membrane protein n=1 Tax=Scopulibacillus darangshiensis TaxID=442528 RepID=A0A4R2NTV0_9BACL|nr:phage holin family protein [Scopulibacillus darangshiensis]TCP24888.1 putative membrane protein [Scopulibacillus darangshiensis]